MSYFETDYAFVRYEEGRDVVECGLTDYVEGEPFREYMDSIIDALEDTGTNQLLSDTRDMRPLDQDDQMWAVRDWAPRAEATGLEDMAFVMPESQIAQMSFDSVMEMAEDTLNRGYFDDIEEARAWLAEQADSESTDEPTVVSGLGD